MNRDEIVADTVRRIALYIHEHADDIKKTAKQARKRGYRDSAKERAYVELVMLAVAIEERVWERIE